jgi:hypothetical protein
MRTSFVLTIALLAGSACAHRSPVTPSKPGAFVMAPGQSISYGRLAVRFIGVSADTRCPADVMCVQVVAGDATVVVETAASGGARRHELLINDTAKRSVSDRGFVVELTELSPNRLVNRPIEAADYRAAIVVKQE